MQQNDSDQDGRVKKRKPDSPGCPSGRRSCIVHGINRDESGAPVDIVMDYSPPLDLVSGCDKSRQATGSHTASPLFQDGCLNR